jgi:hypothetical protein
MLLKNYRARCEKETDKHARTRPIVTISPTNVYILAPTHALLMTLAHAADARLFDNLRAGHVKFSVFKHMAKFNREVRGA